MSDKPTRTTTTLRLDSPLYEALRTAAAKKKIPANEIVVFALTEYLRKEGLYEDTSP